MESPSLRKSLAGVALATAALLLIPGIAMRFSPDVAWGWQDFVHAGLLLFSAGTAVVLARRRLQRPTHRTLAVVAIVLAAALVWAELAVGLFH